VPMSLLFMPGTTLRADWPPGDRAGRAAVTIRRDLAHQIGSRTNTM
jgi:hypothetical protein